MSVPFTSRRRRAEEFDALLQGGAVPDHGPGARRDPLLRVVEGLRQVPASTPRPEFVSSLREQLMAEAETALLQLPAARSAPDDRLGRRTRRERRVALLAGSAALVGSITSIAVASQAALPTDLLYPVKQVLESARSGVASGDQDEGLLALTHAEHRLTEVAELVAREDDEARRAVSPTLDSFTTQAQEGARLLVADHVSTGRDGSIVALREFVVASLDRLDSLTAALPAESSDELVAAGEALLDIDAMARQACPDCGGESITQVPRFVAAGVPGLLLQAVAGTPALPGTGQGGAGQRPGRPQASVIHPSPASSPTSSPGQTPTSPTAPLTPVPTTPPETPPVPTPPAQAPKTTAPRTPASSTPSQQASGGLVDGVGELLVGSGTPTDGSTPSGEGGLVGGVGETLGEVTGSLLGEPVGETVEGAVGLVGQLIGGVLDGPTGKGSAKD